MIDQPYSFPRSVAPSTSSEGKFVLFEQILHADIIVGEKSPVDKQLLGVGNDTSQPVKLNTEADLYAA